MTGNTLDQSELSVMNNNSSSIFEADYYLWKPEDEDKWNNLLSRIRAQLSINNKGLRTKVQFAREVSTPRNRDNLENVIEVTSKLSDLLSTVTGCLKDACSLDKDKDAWVEDEERISISLINAASKDIEVAMKCLKSVSEKVEDKESRSTRRERRRSQEDDLLEHHSDPPNTKIAVAVDLKPEMYDNDKSYLELDDWMERAQVYSTASNFPHQTPPVQLAYLQAIVSHDAWISVKQYMEIEGIEPDTIDFQAGLDILKEVWQKTHDVYSMRLKCMANTFQGKTCSELQTWYYSWQKEARMCNLLNMSEEEYKVFTLLTNMPIQFKTLLMTSNTRPNLKETLEFVDRQMQVESICKNNDRARSRQKKSSGNVCNITEAKCYICNSSSHIRPNCPDLHRKGEFTCGECGKTGHKSAACRGTSSARTSSRSRSGRETSATSATSMSSASPSPSPATRTRERKTERMKKKKKKQEKKDKKRRSDRSTSPESERAESEKRKNRAGRTPNREEAKTEKEKKKKEKKKRESKKNKSNTVDNIDEEEESENNSTNEISVKGRRQINVGKRGQTLEKATMTLDSGSKFSIADEKEVRRRNWKIETISSYENPNLKNPDGTKLSISGKAEVWVELSEGSHKRKISFLITPKLESTFIIGLQDLRRLHWLPRSWPQDIEKWIHLFSEEQTNNVNNISETDKEEKEEEEEEEEEDEEDTDSEEEEEPDTGADEPDEAREQGSDTDAEEGEKEEVKLSSLMDVKTFKDIPNFTTLPVWLQELIEENAETFSTENSVASRMNVTPLKITLKKDVKVPDKHITASLPPIHLRKSADKLMKNMLKNNLVAKADRHTGPVSRAFFKAKRSGEARLLVDFKSSKVNSMIEKSVQPQFSVEQLVSQVPPGMNFFYSADIQNAFFCYPIEDGPEGSDICVFLTHLGKFKFRVLAQGLCVSQFALGETMTEVMEHEDLLHRNEGDQNDSGSLVLVDDIAGFARSEHKIKKMLRTFFERCKKYNIKLNPAKFQFGSQIHFGGLIMSKLGLKPDDNRMSSVKLYPRPTTKKQVSRFLGMATSLASFTSTLLQDCKELRNLTKKDTIFKWESKHEEEWLRIKERLSNPALLHHYQPGTPIAADVDTSVEGLGYTCYSYDPEKGNPGPDNAKLIRCGSGCSKPSWKNYSAIELESTGVLLTARRLQHYFTNHRGAVIRNDHLPFVQAYENKDLSEVSPRLRRIFMELRDLEIKVIWCPATEMMHSDAFSRHPVEEADSFGPDPINDRFNRNESNNVNNINAMDDIEDNMVEDEVDDPLFNSLYKASSECDLYIQAIREIEKKEDIVWKNVPAGTYHRQLKDIWHQISISENSRGEKLMILNHEKFIVPPPAIPEVLKVIDITHGGFPKALGFAQARYWFPHMKTIIEDRINRCMTCQIFSKAKPQEAVLPPHPDQDPCEPFEVLFIDEFTHESKHYVVLVCAYSGYSRIYHLTGRRTASVIIKHLLQFCLENGFPKWIGTDGAKIFTGYEFQNFLKQNKIRHRLSSPMYAQSSGRHEERVSAYKNMLKKLEYEGRCTEAEARWTWEMLNNMPSKPGEFSPARLAFNRERRHPLAPMIQRSGGEDIQGQKQKMERRKRQEQANARKSKRVKKPEPFVVGQRILTQRYSTNNKDKEYVLAGKVIKIRPRSSGRSAVIQLNDGTTTIRNRKMCIIDQDQPQIEIVNNVLSSKHTYIKLLLKDEEKQHMAETYLDNQMQKIKARGAHEVKHLKDLGSHHMLEITTNHEPKSIVKTEKSDIKSRIRFRLANAEEETVDEEETSESEETVDEDETSEGDDETSDEDTTSEDESAEDTDSTSSDDSDEEEDEPTQAAETESEKEVDTKDTSDDDSDDEESSDEDPEEAHLGKETEDSYDNTKRAREKKNKDRKTKRTEKIRSQMRKKRKSKLEEEKRKNLSSKRKDRTKKKKETHG